MLYFLVAVFQTIDTDFELFSSQYFEAQFSACTFSQLDFEKWILLNFPNQ